MIQSVITHHCSKCDSINLLDCYHGHLDTLQLGSAIMACRMI